MENRIIDVRQYPEYAAEHMQGSELVPLDSLAVTSEGWSREQPLQMVCRTGRRAEQAEQLLRAKGFQSVGVLKGGIEAWKQAGGPVSAAEHQPWSMERQVRVGAGALVLSFAALGALASRRFVLGAGVVGIGLIYAGVSDNCMMGRVLGRMPWNRPEQAKA